MGWGIKLTDEQWDELDRIRFATKSADVFRNCLIVLKSHSHDTITSIAEELGCGTDTVVRVRLTARNRQIYLDRGRAYFKVAKDQSRPFIVNADGHSVRATGTAFEVSADPQRFEVLLVEGHVRVSTQSTEASQNGGKGVYTDLDPGTRLSVTGSRTWTLSKVDSGRELAWTEGELRFDNKPLGEIVLEMNRYSHRKIVIDDPAIANRSLYGAFMAGDVDQFVHALTDYKIAKVRSENEDVVVVFERPPSPPIPRSITKAMSFIWST